MKSIIPAMIFLSLYCSQGQRMWDDVRTYHALHVVDDTEAEMFEHDPLRFTESPTVLPSNRPSQSPSWIPSHVPSDLPTKYPTVSGQPSVLPSLIPSQLPSISPSTMAPSDRPTNAPVTETPTAERFAANPVPPNINTSTYFNYDDRPDALYGPGQSELVRHNETYWKIDYQNNAWATRVPPVDWYWNEFDQYGWGPWAGILATKNPWRNRCAGLGRQSPIDLRESSAVCYEHHQIRLRRGDFKLGTGNITAQILPNKLRLLFGRRPCREVSKPECSEPDPPLADFPHNWGGFTDSIHVDFKLPSEHLIMGERFDGEMQIYHIHPTRRRTPAVVAMMKASAVGYNPVLQSVIDQFQYEFDDAAALCANRTRRDRNLISQVHKVLGYNVSNSIDYDSWGAYSTIREDPSRMELQRELQSRFFTPHNEKLVPGIHFWAYDGSLTEPPCSEFVTWYITDIPMTMSFEQLEQLKRIQFMFVDPNCTKTSIHYQESNARPIQDTFDRPVWRCTSANFLSDAVMYPDGDVPQELT